MGKLRNQASNLSHWIKIFLESVVLIVQKIMQKRVAII